jgi:excisionase family DNA binding protein
MTMPMHADAVRSITPDPDPWLTLRQSTIETQVHESTLRREIRAGRLRHARVGGRKSVRIRRSWLAQWLEQSATPREVA